MDYVSHSQKVDPHFSLRRWSKAMGMNSHTLLVMILQGKRSLSLKQVPYFSKGMNLSSPERLYLQALIQFEAAESEEERDLCRLWMSEANPGNKGSIREVDEYLVIAHWVHMAILAMTENRNFTGKCEEIYERLAGKVYLADIRSAVERLKALDLVRETDGRLICTSGRVTTKDDVANRGAREYHKQVAQLGIEAVDKQRVEMLEFQSFAVSVPRSKIPLAKEMIRKFRSKFYEAMTSEPGDEVYQTQIQFFRLTESPSEMVPKEDEGTGSKNQNKVKKR